MSKCEKNLFVSYASSELKAIAINCIDEKKMTHI